MKSMISKPKFRLAELIDGLDASIQGNPDCMITGIAPIQQSMPGHITFLTNSLYKKYLSDTQASAVILSDEDASDCPVNVVISNNPYYIYAKIAAFFDEQPKTATGKHPSVIVGERTKIDSTVSIGANCYIGDEAKIDANVIIGAGCVIGNNVEIGENTIIDSNVTVYRKVKIGKRNRIAAGVVLGADGFGFANQEQVWHKVPQLGSVVIGDDVDIGANTTIDRGAVEHTVIGNGVKLDNLIHIGHNVIIGDNTIIAGCTGVAGSTVIGKNCMIGGACCLTGHITICDNAMITGMSGVSKSIREPGMYSSGVVGAVPTHEFKKNNARFYRLENIFQRVKDLELALKEMKERENI